MNQNSSLRVLMFPWLAHGHISPFLELAKRLTERDFEVYLCSTPANLDSIKEKLGEKYSKSIRPLEIHLPTLPELPPHYHTTKGLPPHLMPKLKGAFEMAKPNFANVLEAIQPDLLIYDLIQPWVAATASLHNIPAVEFIATGAAMAAYMLHVIKNPEADFPFQEIYLYDCEKAEITDQLKESSRNRNEDKDRPSECMERSCDIILIKTFKEIEGKYFDYLSDLLEKKIVPFGPLVEEIAEPEEEHSSIMDFLHKKDPCSTVFVSFGSEYILSKEDMEEIALGLELSNVNFIWVVRFPAGEEMRVEDALPEGFLERVAERAMIVENWAPQAKIVGHANIGGFLSHCGWSSAMESLKFGVPIIAMPMINDQPVNARVLENVGVAVEVVKDKDGKVQRREVAKVIKQVMVEETGEALRRKAKLLSDKIQCKGEEEIDGLVEELMKLCKKQNV